MQYQFEKRYHNNCTAYIIVYTFLGIVSGLIYDILVTYLMAVSPEIARSISSYMGISTFAAALLSVLSSRLGFRKIMISAVIVISSSIALISLVTNQWLICAAVLLLMTGTSLFDVMLAPFIAAYTSNENRTSTFAKISIASVIGTILGTSAGGPAIVWVLSRRLNIGYQAAKLLTENAGKLSPIQYSNYIASYRIILIVFAVVSMITMMPVLKIKESDGDYRNNTNDRISRKNMPAGLTDKYIILFLIFAIVSRFASALFVPQVSVYLTRLGLDRATVSLLATLQYISILVFMALSPKIAGKIGRMKMLLLLCLFSIPFMLILANGYIYGNGVQLIIGTALFFRAGLANASTPVINSLSMEVVPKVYRSIYASLVFIMQGLAQIFAGLFANTYLYNQDNGYGEAYYFAVLLNTAAYLMLYFVFSGKYNRVDNTAEKIADN